MFPLFPQKPAAADTYIDVCSLEELPAGAQTTAVVGFMRVLVLRAADQQLHAMADVCPHALQPLAGGAVSDGKIVCPKHGACFELGSGRSLNRMTNKPLTLYRVRVREGRIEVAAPAA